MCHFKEEHDRTPQKDHTQTHLRQDKSEDEAPENLREKHASGLIQRLVHKEHLVLVSDMAGEEVRDAHHQDERVDDGVCQTNLAGICNVDGNLRGGMSGAGERIRSSK